jgi:hypothetical protein
MAHEPGAAIELEPAGLFPHVSVSVKSLDGVVLPLLTPPTVSACGVITIFETVTLPLPPTLMATVCGALIVLPVGTPNERLLLAGETVTVTWACAAPANAPNPIAATVSARTNILRTLIAASLRGFPSDNSNFFCGVST